MGQPVENQTTNRPRDLVRIAGTGCRRIRAAEQAGARIAARVGVGESVFVGVARKADRVPLTASRPPRDAWRLSATGS